MLYNPQGVQDFFDHYGTREWERLERTLQGRIKYFVHRQYIDRFVKQGMRVLDAGCGPGRFSIDMARSGAHLTLVDLSQEQLDQARQNIAAVELLGQVDAIHRLDILDMNIIDSQCFDVVVCIGATVSYTCDQYEIALKELTRVLRPGGHLLISVCSLYGTLRLIGPYDEQPFLDPPDAHIEWQAVLSGKDVIYSCPGSPEFRQPLVMFTSNGLRNALEKEGLIIIEMAAANPLVSEAAQIPQITASPRASAELTALELALCNKPGLVDSGEHLIAVAFKP